MKFVKQLADRVGDGGLSQTSQSDEKIYWRCFRWVYLVEPCHYLRDDVNTCSIGARMTSKVVEINGSIETCITGTR